MKYQINEDLAKRANDAYSFRDYDSGSTMNSYHNYLKAFNIAVEELKESNKKFNYPASEEELELVEYYSNKYAKKLAFAINKENEITSRCPSVMICGAGNFPVRKKQKQVEAMDKHWEETKDLYNPTNNYYFNKIYALLTNTAIKSNDEHAIEKLENKLQELQEQHEKMKKTNSYYRKNGTLKGYEGITDEKAEKRDKEIEESWYKQPFAPFSLTNSNSKIKSVRERIEQLKKEKAAAGNEANKYKTVKGVQVIENAEEMRIQLLFDNIPNDETRILLKHNGFHWSPRFKAWQRLLNSNGKYAVKIILDKLAK